MGDSKGIWDCKTAFDALTDTWAAKQKESNTYIYCILMNNLFTSTDIGKTNQTLSYWTTIARGFCDIQNNKGRSKGYQPKPTLSLLGSLETKKKWKSRFATQSARSWDDYPWPWVSLIWLFDNLHLWRHEIWFRKSVRVRELNV